MRRCIVLLVMVATFSVYKLSAGGLSSLTVPLLHSGNFEYRISKQHAGSIEAWDTERNKLVWQCEIYMVLNTSDEPDRTEISIKTLELKDDSLIITNEHSSQYRLDLRTRKVEVLRGSLIEVL